MFGDGEYVTVKRAAELTGYTEAALQRKIDDGVFPGGKNGIWLQGPDKRRMICLYRLYRWVESHAEQV